MRYVCYATALALVLWTVASAVTLVRSEERAVVRRFGEVLDYKPGPGLFIGLPWGMDRVDRVAVSRVQRVVVGWSGVEDADEQAVIPAGQMLTGDHNLVIVKAEVDYSPVEEHLDKYVLQADRVDALVARTAEALLAQWIAGRTVDHVLLLGKRELPEYVASGLQERIAPYQIGVKIRQVSIANLDPPDEVKEAFERLAHAAANKNTVETQARQEADQRLKNAETQKIRIDKDTASYARVQRLDSEADASAFLNRLGAYRELVRRNPDALNTMWQDDMTRLYAKMRESGRIDVLDHYLTGEGLNITQFPLLPKKK
ncbi:MAG: hypothetical protein HY040_26715 [Planctomycetes bacterium]|nr:hypothetical protein [Planctomycetota bacterium]